MCILKDDLLENIDFINHGFFEAFALAPKGSEPERIDTEGAAPGGSYSLNVGIGRGDDNNAIQNRKKIADYFKIDISNLIILNQIHSSIVHTIDSNNLDKYQFQSIEKSLQNEGDAIITNQSGVLIGVNTADCAPILLCDIDIKYIAVIHSGWKGTIASIIENTINKLKELGCNNIIASIGPCIHSTYFEMDPNMIPMQYSDFLRRRGNLYYFDMLGLIKQKLLQSGVKRISIINIDTMIDKKFFSYRRMSGKNGVQFSGIMIK